tara:strand:- start:6202 stop:6528 length:327 start_codon:yes stop_codon:yes gene_type:complete
MVFKKLPGKFATLLELIEELVQLAEAEYDEPGSGAEKRAYVIAEVNEQVDVPIFFSEEREGELIGVIVDFIVELYNRGKLFAAELAQEALDDVMSTVTSKITDLLDGE